MRKVTGIMTAVLGRIIIIGFGIQIVLGVLWMCNAFTSLHGLGEGIVFVAQIALAVCAAYFFLCVVGVRREWVKVFGCLAMVTFPMVLQCHMSLGIQSAASSMFLVLTGWLISMESERRKVIRVAAALAIALLVLGTAMFYQGMQRMSVCVASRFAWSTLDKGYLDWPKEYRDKISYLVVANSSYEAGGIKESLAPYLVRAMGEKETDKILFRVSALAWKKNSSRIWKEMAWDGAGYLLSPIVASMQLEGRAYDSYTGANYKQFLEPNPRLGSRYMDYGCWWFKVGLAAMVLLFAMRPMEKKDIHVRNLAIVGLTGLVMVLLYTLGGAGQMDYRNSAFLLCAWLAAMIVAAEKGLTERME